MGLFEIEHDQRADRHFRPDIKEDRRRAEGEAGPPQQAEAGEDRGAVVAFALEAVAVEPDRAGDQRQSTAASPR